MRRREGQEVLSINFLRPWEGFDFSGSIDSDLHLFSQSSESDESERKSESLSSSTLLT